MAEKLLMLALSPTMESGILAKWIKKEGEVFKSGDVLCEIETDKATMEYEAPGDGVLLKILLQEGENASVGDPIAITGKAGEDISAFLPETAPAASENKGPSTRSSPLARKLAQNSGISLETITGSGPKGRIVKRDVEENAMPAAPSLNAASANITSTNVQSVNTASANADFASIPGKAQIAGVMPARQDEILPVSGKRKIIAQRLSESMFSAPHYYLKLTVAMDGVLQARKQYAAATGEKISINAFLMKFAAEALKKHPVINSTWNGSTITRHGSIDIGLAVALKDGLITPVVRDCGSKGMLQIERELKELIQKAQNEALKPEEYTGATFTISSLGSFGIEEFTAIINPPGSAILAVGEIIKEQVVNGDDSISIKSNMKLTLSCDHRVIDGAVGATFMAELKNMIQEPVRALY